MFVKKFVPPTILSIYIFYLIKMKSQNNQSSTLEESLKLIRQKYNNVMNGKDVELVSAWLDKLDQGVSTSEEPLITSYALYLNFLLDQGSLHYPFIHPPPSGKLEPLKEILDVEKGRESACLGRSIDLAQMPTCVRKGEQWVSSSEGVECAKRGNNNNNNNPDMYLSFNERFLQMGSLVPSPLAPSKCSQKGKLQNDIPQLNQIVSETEDCEKLYRFVYRVSPHTIDGGSAMKDVVAFEMSNFRDFVRSVLEMRVGEIKKVLAKEEITLTRKFETSEMFYKAKISKEMHKIKENYPKFNYEQYIQNKDYVEQFVSELTEDKIEENLQNNSTQEDVKAIQLKTDFIKRLADEAEGSFNEKEKQYEELKKKVNKINKNMMRSIGNLDKMKMSLLQKLEDLFCRYSDEAYSVNLMLQDADIKGNLQSDKHLISLIQSLG